MYSTRLSWSFSPNAFSERVADLKRQGAPLFDLTVSNPTGALSDYPNAEIRHAFTTVDDFAYRPDPLGTRHAREAISEYYSADHLRVTPEQLVLTASTSEAYAILFKLLCDPGDDVLTLTPSYPLFEYLAALESVRLTSSPLQYDGHWYVDVESLRQAITPRTRAIVVVNPNNPTGSFLKIDEARALSQIAHQHGLAVICDEVFKDYAFDTDPNRVETFIQDDAVMSFSVNGLSKCAGMPQMKLAWIAVNGPAAERKQALQRLELIADTYLSVNTPVQNALPELLNVGRSIRDRLLTRARRNLQAVKTELSGSPARALRVEGGWSAIIRVPEIQTEEDWITMLLEEHRTIVQPGYFFDLANGAYIVVSLITREDVFLQGIEALRDLTSRLTRS